LSTVTDQLTLALENAQLFQQTQDALSALSVSERYQKSIAQATALLTERGLAALPEVLRLLGEAAQVSRVYYIETLHERPGLTQDAQQIPTVQAGTDRPGTLAEHGSTSSAYWHIVTEWHANDVPPQIDNPAIQRLSTRWLAPWLERLSKDGYIAEITQDAEPATRAFLQEFGTLSILQFAIPSTSSRGLQLPGCIGFDQVDYSATGLTMKSPPYRPPLRPSPAPWREDLLKQLQNNLAETEALYLVTGAANAAWS
jgi:hypothetical protein